MSSASLGSTLGSPRGGAWLLALTPLGSLPNPANPPKRLFVVTRSREHLSSGENRAGWADSVARPSGPAFCDEGGGRRGDVPWEDTGQPRVVGAKQGVRQGQSPLRA